MTELKLQFGGSANVDRVVTVAMPRSLPELQHTAAQNFGHSGCLRLYHKGTSLLYHPSQMRHLQDGDTIIVRKSDSHRPSTSGDTPRMQSTQQADFQKYPATRPRDGRANDYASILSDQMKGGPLKGMSRYAIDYVKHPMSAREAFKPPSALELHDDPLGTTTYKKEFLWRECNRPKTSANDQAVRESSLSQQDAGARFDGDSSYRMDYKRNQVQRRDMEQAVVMSRALRASSLFCDYKDFSGSTTYSADFTKLPAGRQRSLKPKENERAFEPFDGTSEYRRTYHEQAVREARPASVHLTSEKFDGVTSEVLCDAAEAAAREGRTVEWEVPVTADFRLAVAA